jgi:hypothetical protein
MKNRKVRTDWGPWVWRMNFTSLALLSLLEWCAAACSAPPPETKPFDCAHEAGTWVVPPDCYPASPTYPACISYCADGGS